MNDAFCVRRIERVCDFDGEIEQRLQVNRPAADAMLQRLALHLFHHDVGFAVLIADFVDGADIRMI